MATTSARHALVKASRAVRVLRCPLRGVRLVADEALPAGTVVASEFCKEVQQVPNKYTIRRDVGDAGAPTHLLVTDPIRLLNHSFEPTVRVTFDAAEPTFVSVVAVRDIDEGDDLCFDYTTTERDLAEPFEDAATGRRVA